MTDYNQRRNHMQMASTIVAAIIGGIAGAIAGLIGDGFLAGLFPGAIAGGVVGFLFSLAPRSFGDPLIAVESFSPAGFVGGIAGSVASNAGSIGGFISCGVGWTLGLLLPAMLIALMREKLGDDEMTPEKIMCICSLCGKQFQFGHHRYDGKRISRYQITVCMSCWRKLG